MSHEKLFLPETIQCPILLMQQFYQSYSSRSGIKHRSHHFIITTIDQHFLLYTCENDRKKLTLHAMRRFQSPVCSVYFDPSTHQIYTGQFNGSLRIISIVEDTLQVENQHFVLKDSSPATHIDLIYCSGEKQFCIRGSQQILILNNRNLSLLGRFKFQSLISSAISLMNLYSQQMVGCISFLNNKPPIIFDCFSIHEFETQYHKAFEQYSEIHEGEIIKMNYEGKSKDYNFLVCGIRQNNEGSISVYTISKYEHGYWCERAYRFNLDKGLNVEFIHIKNGILLLTMWNAYSVIEIRSRKVKNQNSREEFKFCWGFILNADDEEFSCLLSKGFNYERPTDWKKRTCLHLLSREYSN